ncbi:MAG: hypothetical protein KC912_00310 [Proteobacteria bacterium]|nr:hypothetical protein [Pseudomonadota bacterium]
MPSLAFAAPEDALSPAVRQFYVAAVEAEASGDSATAEGGYRAVLRADDAFVPARLGLARTLVDAQRPEDALTVLGGAPFDADAVQARGRLLLALERWEGAYAAFLRLGRLSPESEGAYLLQAEALSHTDPSEAHERAEAWLGHPNSRLDAHAARVLVAVADALRAEDAESEEPASDRARLLLESVEEKAGSLDGHELLVDRLERYRVEERAQLLARGGSEALAADVRGQLDRARLAFAAGRVEEAHRALAPLVRAHPRSAELLATWADVQREQGQLDEAERALRVAAALEPLEAAHPHALGLLLLDGYGGKHAADAEVELARAARLRPGSAQIWVALADARWAAGRLDEAAAAYERARSLGQGDWSLRAEQRSAARPDRALAAEAPALEARESGLPLGYWVARVYAADGDIERALAELEALEGPAGPEIDELAGSLALTAGDLDRAELLYERALLSRPDEPRLLAALGDVLASQGRDAQATALLERAAKLPGGAAARLPLARRAFEGWKLWDAEAHLDLFFAGETGGPAYSEALVLRERVGDRQRLVWTSGVVGAGLLLLLPLVAVASRRRGQSVEQLIEASPGSFAELAPVLSALRHEVLKHNTSLLEPVADALERGDDELVAWANERLFGERGVVARFFEQCERLRAVGRRHGEALNLSHVDPLFGPALVEVHRLGGLRKDLERMRPGAAAALREIAQVLNRDTYAGLGRLLALGQRVAIHDGLVASAWDDVQAEPARRDAPPVPLVLDIDTGLFVRGDHTDLHDVLVNLFRNALQAGATRLAVSTEVQEDWVTGLESIVIRVADDAEGRVTTEQIRGRFIERGLGLVVDLVHRFGGSVSVADHPGYAKAIAVRLPRAEDIGETA